METGEEVVVDEEKAVGVVLSVLLLVVLRLEEPVAAEDEAELLVDWAELKPEVVEPPPILVIEPDVELAEVVVVVALGATTTSGSTDDIQPAGVSSPSGTTPSAPSAVKQ